MTVPQTTPLMLLSEYALLTNTNNGVLAGIDANLASGLRRQIVTASDYVMGNCRRRFDERIETRAYTSLDERIGGDLLGPYDLQLDDDCKSLTAVVNGDGQTLSGFKLVSARSTIGSNVNYGTQVHLNIYGGVVLRSGGNDPIESIKVTGIWGYGGQWVPLPITASAMQPTDTSMTVSDGTQLEPGMVVRLINTTVTPNTTEYIYIDSVISNIAQVGRAFNGSTAVAQVAATPVARWQAIDRVTPIVRRLVQWVVEQTKTPTGTQATIGEFTYPVDLAGLPKDIYLWFRDTALNRVGKSIAV